MEKEITFGVSDKGTPIVFKTTEPPRILLVGQTRSGKSVGLANLVLLYAKAMRENAAFIGTDMKAVSMHHLQSRFAADIVTDANSVLPMLQKVQQIMQDRYAVMQNLGIDKIEPHSELAKEHPCIIFCCEELVALMNADMQKSVRDEIRRWFTNFMVMASAANMGCIVATQSVVESLTIPTAARSQFRDVIVFKTTLNEVKIIAPGYEDTCKAHLLNDPGWYYISQGGNITNWVKGQTFLHGKELGSDYTRKYKEVADSYAIDVREIGFNKMMDSPF